MTAIQNVRMMFNPRNSLRDKNDEGVVQMCSPKLKLIFICMIIQFSSFFRPSVVSTDNGIKKYIYTFKLVTRDLT